MPSAKACLLAAILTIPAILRAATTTILGWNNLGMHCMDSDYSVFSVLPPYNTIEAQLIVNGLLVTSSNGYTVTYQAIADPSGSINSTAIGKGNFYTYAKMLYGKDLAPDMGLAGWAMPGISNIKQSMVFEQTNVPAAGVATPVNWFRAEGIPISPYDDAQNKNPYPLMRLIAWNGAVPIATNDVVLPVSDEMDCRACHASGTAGAAKPAAGWVWDGLPERDYRLNILRLHDERQFATNLASYATALASNRLNPLGLYRSVTTDGKPVLCAGCHASEALGLNNFTNIPPLTTAMHGYHAHVSDPVLNTNLDSAVNRSTCYRCHPGSTTKCLRGAMGAAVASDGTMGMQCQSCHGNMSTVGSPKRVGWFMEPNCQSCHTGSAMQNSGQIRYTSVFTDTNGTVRTPAIPLFATNPDTPTNGLSLFRFSVGHGGLQCEACHGSTHAEFPSSHTNDNVRNQALQGHVGVMAECTSCHGTLAISSTTATNGPHGMHPIGPDWISGHHDYIQGNLAQCQGCHGSDSQGTVLSRAQGPRTLVANFDAGAVTNVVYRGAIIGCYACHNGPGSESRNTNAPPSVTNVATNTTNDQSVAMTLPATGVGAVVRVISQPANGSVGLDTNTSLATYFPNPGFIGTDIFTFAAYDGAKNSNLATGAVSVAQGPCSLGATAYVPPTYPALWSVPFTVVPAVTNFAGAVSFEWNFGDGTPHSTNQYAAHTYSISSNYTWSVVAKAATASVTNSGTITIGNPVVLGSTRAGGSVTVAWPMSTADSLLESSGSLGPAAQWTWITNTPSSSGGLLYVTLPSAGNEFFRLRRPW